MFQNWGFEANFGFQPDFVLKTDKSFNVSAMERNSKSCPTGNLINNYVDRISSLQIDHEGILMEFLINNPAKFTQLTSLDLESVYFDDEALLKLAPQLEHLRLAHLKYTFEEDDEDKYRVTTM